MTTRDHAASELDEHRYRMSLKQQRKRGGKVPGGAKPKPRPDRRARRADGGDLLSGAMPPNGLSKVPDLSQSHVPAVNVSVSGGGPPKPPPAVQQVNPVNDAFQGIEAMEKLSKVGNSDAGSGNKRRGGRVTPRGKGNPR